MTRHTTTGLDLKRLKEASDAGMYLEAAARFAGLNVTTARHWAAKLGLVFRCTTLEERRVLRWRGRHLSADIGAGPAVARLTTTWTRLCDAAAGMGS